ncbi:MAG: hypothetical protein R2932_33810 [Caldilineaceae bacterium]
MLDGIGLLGYDVQPAPLTAGAILYLQLYWQVEARRPSPIGPSSRTCCG